MRSSTVARWPTRASSRALPAIGLTPDAGRLDLQVDLVAEPGDILAAFATPDPERAEAHDELHAAVGAARGRGCLTVAFTPLGAEWELVPPVDDPFVHQELVETLYHVLWELVELGSAA